jgi:hypothetical protein
MRNHYHLLIQTPKPNLSQFMMHFNGSYTTAFNRRHRRSGHLYQGRFHAVVIERDAYLLEVSRYLHLNPVRVRGVVRGTARDRMTVLSGYRWSSYRGYVSLKYREPFVEYLELLDYFGGDTVRGKRGYAEFVREGTKEECRNPFAQAVGRLMLGSEKFVERLKDQFLSEEINVREQPSLRTITEVHAPERILSVISEVLGVGIERLTARGRHTLERGLAMETVYRYCGLTQPRVGKLFGGVDYSTVSLERKRFMNRLKRDGRLRQILSEITEAIANIQD